MAHSLQHPCKRWTESEPLWLLLSCLQAAMVALRQSSKLHLLTIAVFTAALFLPLIGQGFVHDDFLHLYSAANDSLVTGLTTATGGPFYAPIAWVTFRSDWFLWGMKPFPIALENLLLHILTMFLIYALTVQLWGSKVAGFWAAFGFGLLLPANVWATMWISTRAHLLATAFYAAAMIATLLFLRSARLVHAAVALALGFLAIFSKESAITLPAALACLAIYEKRRDPRKTIPALGLTVLIAALFGVIAIYLTLRARSGAVPFSLNIAGTYSYAVSLRNFWGNLLEYSWRTYGMLIIIGGALAFSRYLSGRKLRFNLLTRNEVVFSIVLCSIMISPFILLNTRSGIYMYMPEVASALLLGAAARSIYQPDDGDAARSRPAAMVPVLFVVATFTIFMVGQSQRWIKMAKTTTEVLNQISAQVTKPEPNTYFVLRYTTPDRFFPGGFAEWSFPWALRLHYADTSLNGKIVPADALETSPAGSPRVNLLYTSESGKIKVEKLAED